MDFVTPPATPPKPDRIERLAQQFVLREAVAGRISNYFGATKLIADTRHHFLVIDRRSAGEDLRAIAAEMRQSVAAEEESAGETPPLPSPRSPSSSHWFRRGWALLRRQWRRGKK